MGVVDWDEYWADPTVERRNQLVLANMGIIDRVLRRYPGYQQEDMSGWAAEGLIQAVERWHPAGGASFQTYAYKRVWGAVRDGWREMDYLPRRARDIIHEYLWEKESLSQEIGTVAGDTQVVDALGLTVADRYQTAAAFGFLAARVDTDDMDWSRHAAVDDDPEVNPEAAVEAEAVREWLGDLISALPERQMIVVTLYYHHDMRLRDIGQVLGVTESQACKLHTAALRSLRAKVFNVIDLRDAA